MFKHSGIALLVALGSAFAQEIDQSPSIPQAFRGRDAVSRALHDLTNAAPIYGDMTSSRPAFDINTKTYLSTNYCRGCPDSISFLIETKRDVDAELLKLARSDQPLWVRYRAVHILAERGNIAAAALLTSMGTSKNPDERMVAWQTYCWAIMHKKLKPPSDFGQVLEQYAQETDSEVRDVIEWFLGACRAKIAVKSLMTMVEKTHSHRAIWALGVIRDPVAVPSIIKEFYHGSNCDCCFEALGKLATAEAVDLLIAHLDDYGAVEALMETKSAKALWALRDHMKKLQTAGSSDTQPTRIGLIRLSLQDPRPALIEIAANPGEVEEARNLALRVLRDYDTSALTASILRIYRSDSSSDIQRSCIELLGMLRKRCSTMPWWWKSSRSLTS